MFALSFLYNPFVDAILKEKPLFKGFFIVKNTHAEKYAENFLKSENMYSMYLGIKGGIYGSREKRKQVVYQGQNKKR